MYNKLIDLTGQQFGIWYVMEQAPRRDNKTRWLCECQACGAQRSLRSTTLRRSVYAACDGRHLERLSHSTPSPRIKPAGYAAATERFNGYKSISQRRGVSFEISRQQFMELTQQDCHYCGTKPSQRFTRRHYNGSFVYNGIDRKDSAQGYTSENCVPCCGLCNTMKQDLPYENFLAHIAQIQRIHPRVPQAASKKDGIGLGGRQRENKIEVHDTSADRKQRYLAIAALHQEGKTLLEIATILDIARMTAYRGLIASGSIQPRTYKPRTANHA